MAEATVSNQVATQQPSVVANEATLSEFDDIPDEVISGMSGEPYDEEDDEGSGTQSQPGVTFSAHDDEGAENTTVETGEEQNGESDQQVEQGTQQTEQQTQQTEQAEQQVETPEQKAAREAEFETKRQAFVVELEKSYQLTPEDADAALTQPEKVLPKLAANLHARVLQEVVQQVQYMIPSMVQHVNQSSNVETKARTEFFSKWPQLNKPEYEKAIIAAGKMYRELNPKATPTQAIEAIGKLAVSSLGLPMEGSGETTSTTPAKGVFKPNKSTGGARATPQRQRKPETGSQEPDWGDLSKDE